jgi:hypothetical protein
MDVVEEDAKEHGAVTSRAPVNIQGVTGMEIAWKHESPAATTKPMVRMRTLEPSLDIYSMMARSGPGNLLPHEADGRFNSLPFDRKPAVEPSTAVGKAAKASAPARQTQIAKIVRDDPTAGAAVRTLPVAIEAGDEETPREVTLPDPDLDRLRPSAFARLAVAVCSRTDAIGLRGLR